MHRAHETRLRKRDEAEVERREQVRDTDRPLRVRMLPCAVFRTPNCRPRMTRHSRSPRSRQAYPGAIKAVDGVSFAVEAGICFGLLGPNGAGKTTTVEIMEGITPADRRRGAVPRRAASARAFARKPASSSRRPRCRTSSRCASACTLFRSLYARGARLDEIDAALRAGEAAGSRQPQALRRTAAAPDAGHRAGQRPGGPVPRRAHHRARSAGAPQLLGPDPRRSRRGARP